MNNPALAEKHDWLVTCSTSDSAELWSVHHQTTAGYALRMAMGLRQPGQEVWISIRAMDTDPL